MKQTLLWIGTALVIALSSTAVAAAPATADSEYTRGKAALKAGDATTALVAFKAGLALAGSDEGTAWQLILAIGLTYEKGGQPGHAIEYYQRFFEQSEQHQDALSPKWKRRRVLVQNDISKLEKQVAGSHGYVTVATEPSGVQVFVDGQRAGADGDAVSPVGFYLSAGEHVISVRLAGHQLAEQTVELAAGKIRPLRFVLEPEPIPPPDDTKAETIDELVPATVDPIAPVVTTTATYAPPSQLGPWLVIGTGGALAVAACVTAGLRAGASSDLDAFAAEHANAPETGLEKETINQAWAEHEDTVSEYTLATSALVGVAAVTVTSGLIWLFMHGDDVYADTPTTVSILPTTGGVAGHATWRF